MEALKIALLCTALFATAFAYSATWGVRNSTNVLLLNEAVVTPLKNFDYVSSSVKFPKDGQTNNRTITAIFVYDRFTNSSGATPSISSGGVGTKNTLISFKSQYSYGINSTVEIYGQ